MKYRIYASGDVVSQDYFEEHDNSFPYYDDYQEYDIPDLIVEDICLSESIRNFNDKVYQAVKL